MEKIILKDYGWCKILTDNTDCFICFDEGQIVVKMHTYPISKQEAESAIKNEIEAERIARLVQLRNLK